MPGLPSDLYNRCRTILLRCNEFDRDASLRTVFITSDLYPFRDALPGGSSKSGRVDAVLDYLLELRIGDGAPVLPIFLHALRDRYAAGNALRNELEALAQSTDAALSRSPQPTTSVARGPSAPSPSAGQLPTEIRNRYALLVGVRDYVDPSYRPLPHTVHDVTELARVLSEAGYTVRALHSAQQDAILRPTRENIWGELENLAQGTGPGDLLLVHFGGHGTVYQDRAYLLPANARKHSLHRTAIDLDEFEQILTNANAQARILILDACHSGIGRDTGGMDEAFERHVYLESLGSATLAACRKGEVAYEHHASPHGAFTYYLLEGLRGAATREGSRFVSFDALKDYVTNEVKKWAIARGCQQTPNATTQLAGDPPLVEVQCDDSPSSAPRTPVPNPFGDTGRIADPGRFFDRDEVLRQAFEELNKGVNLALVGESQVGKSSILSMICALGPEEVPDTTFAYLSLEWVENEDEFYEALCDTLHIEVCRGYKLLRALRGKRYVLCLDEIEKMAWDGFTVRLRSQLRGLADGAAAPLKLVIASRSPMAHLFPDSPELDSPLAGICHQLDIGGFTPDVARVFLRDKLRDTGIAFTDDEVATLLTQTNGHPAQLQRVAAALFTDKQNASRARH